MSFLKACDDHLSADAAYAEAVANCRNDWRHAGNPHGNIGPGCQSSLDRNCTAGGVSKDVVLLAVEKHRSFEAPAGAAAVDVAARAPVIARLVPLNDFIRYNVKDRRNTRGGRADALRVVREATRVAGDVPRTVLNGTTGRPGGVCWWTLPEGHPAASSGAAFAQELALPRATIDAGTTQGFLEVRLSPDAAPEPFYKPSALDGFGAHTRFRPDATDCWHGWSAPEPGYGKRPEVIARSFEYRRLARSVKVTIRHWPPG